MAIRTSGLAASNYLMASLKKATLGGSVSLWRKRTTSCAPAPVLIAELARSPNETAKAIVRRRDQLISALLTRIVD
jgi:hypothetical protein